MSNQFLSVIDARPARRPALGDLGEALAARFLEGSGYELVVSNFKVPIGRNTKGVAVTGEIDLIALDGKILCFIEVKTRRSDDFAPIAAAVDARKQRQIVRAARAYRRLFQISDIEYRYDVVTVLIPLHSEPQIELIKGFWDESKFRKKRRWASGWMNDL